MLDFAQTKPKYGGTELHRTGMDTHLSIEPYLHSSGLTHIENTGNVANYVNDVNHYFILMYQLVATLWLSVRICCHLWLTILEVSLRDIIFIGGREA